MMTLILLALCGSGLFSAALWVWCVLQVAGNADRRIEQFGKPTTEAAIQEQANALVWLVFHALAWWSAVSWWLRAKRMCAWHQPKQVRMGGNPLARKVTHGICPECFARVSGEIAAHEAGMKTKKA